MVKLLTNAGNVTTGHVLTDILTAVKCQGESKEAEAKLHTVNKKHWHDTPTYSTSDVISAAGASSGPSTPSSRTDSWTTSRRTLNRSDSV